MPSMSFVLHAEATAGGGSIAGASWQN